MARLDLQKPASKAQSRLNTRNPARGYFATTQQDWGNSANQAFNHPAWAGPTSANFTGIPTITASDAPNAAKLTGLGFRANPQTNWTTGQKITVNGFTFNWTGSAWAAGTHA